MKRYTLILGTAVAASLLSTPLLALDRANTSQKGSLLVFPKVDVSGNHNTLIRIQNDYSDSVSLKCYWKNGTKFLRDFQLELTKFQPIWISAKDGGGTYAVPPFPVYQPAVEGQDAVPYQPEETDPDTGAVITPSQPAQPAIPAQPAQNINQDYLDKIGYTIDENGDISPSGSSEVGLPANATTAGELQCWAVGAGGEIRWNHLAGSATVVDATKGTAYDYNAWGFRCLVGGNGEECVVADAGRLDLDGAEYEACPKKLMGHFSPADEEIVDGVFVTQNELTIASCNQDLDVANQQFHFTMLSFNVWNEQEVKYTGASQCMDSWHSGLLGEMQNNGEHFTAESLMSKVARFKVKGFKSTTCEQADDEDTYEVDESIVTEDAGLLGVMATTYEFGTGTGFYDETGTSLRGVGNMNGFIAYDSDGEIEERSAR
ncbi:hypothetical protein [Nitrosococcus watsonii]|uniref:Uncharacterized protein n=1 Tax=Nitrosococcus watsoni (strain C-113) TaxID=105559 RepID=D8KAV0_NITWC|nr:hypothetical protein [Nitrosococcus watsonii]ADJ29527.1 conserved hypothetical protein [Nitrosococcus watsonii C-113]